MSDCRRESGMVSRQSELTTSVVNFELSRRYSDPFPLNGDAGHPKRFSNGP